jgi:hypothetical protein
MVSIQRVRLSSHHHASRTKHTKHDATGVAPFPPFVELEIARYPREQGCYLFHICADGQATDTWHESIDDAIDQAEWEFGVKAEEWIRSEGP